MRHSARVPVPAKLGLEHALAIRKLHATGACIRVQFGGKEEGSTPLESQSKPISRSRRRLIG